MNGLSLSLASSDKVGEAHDSFIRYICQNENNINCQSDLADFFKILMYHKVSKTTPWRKIQKILYHGINYFYGHF